jgi:arsenate reductase
MPSEVLMAALDRFGERLMNTRSTTWRGLSEAERARPPGDLLAAHPTLMKRPLVVDGDRMVLGWDKAAQAELGVI